MELYKNCNGIVKLSTIPR